MDFSVKLRYRARYLFPQLTYPIEPTPKYLYERSSPSYLFSIPHQIHLSLLVLNFLNSSYFFFSKRIQFVHKLRLPFLSFYFTVFFYFLVSICSKVFDHTLNLVFKWILEILYESVITRVININVHIVTISCDIKMVFKICFEFTDSEV